jgi:hypothetical protein
MKHIKRERNFARIVGMTSMHSRSYAMMVRLVVGEFELSPCLAYPSLIKEKTWQK